MRVSFSFSSLAVQLLAITWKEREDWSNPALKASSQLTPRGSLITPPKAWISVRTNHRQPGNMARHSFVCEVNTRQVLSTKSVFDLLMCVCRSESRALLWQFSRLQQKLWKTELLGAVSFVFSSSAKLSLFFMRGHFSHVHSEPSEWDELVRSRWQRAKSEVWNKHKSFYV